ncbi:16S rRNA (guanine(966)-N(2))-methyltransferase RsmD [Clostridium sp. USBA 49]|jgi:16S rRNA (guanine(966)-N(2))-methyltransferase RsmD|uniref:16S rRNA (guanine(966)-N(2))-methyltransferase RsmD n=1 Tax=Clostridium TaxID=1485 RepID=UPI00099A5423|nr:MULTISPECIES: 16S rRNA (guanine(966)-N(2))-methyltransferase RsmD [Clostridium]SKA76270.1 16S rRNA (guanine(966)-N(2))-methyltransferase RsmD [Clostridium sp. USBA 49]
MRIISGIAKGRKLLSPEGMETRPTLDRVKESIFNIIQNRIPGAIVLDVFAGTGSLGLEAASRGASQCHLVDKNFNTFKLLQQNVENLKFNDICRCYNIDSYKALNEFSDKGIIFDLIFIDPPYLKNMIPPAIDIISQKCLLESNGIIVTKIDSSEKIYEGNEKIMLVDSRKYGNTIVCLYKYRED